MRMFFALAQRESKRAEKAGYHWWGEQQWGGTTSPAPSVLGGGTQGGAVSPVMGLWELGETKVVYT